MKINKILLGLLVVFVFVVIFEVGYLIYLTPKRTVSQPDKSPENSSVLPLPTYRPSVRTRDVENWEYVLIKGLTKDITLTTVNEGTIRAIEIYDTPEKMEKNHGAKFKISLKSITNPEVMQDFYFKELDEDHLKTASMSGSKEVDMKLADLHVGDRVTMATTANAYPAIGGEVKSLKIVKSE